MQVQRKGVPTRMLGLWYVATNRQGEKAAASCEPILSDDSSESIISHVSTLDSSSYRRPSRENSGSSPAPDTLEPPCFEALPGSRHGDAPIAASTEAFYASAQVIGLENPQPSMPVSTHPRILPCPFC
jgi:hypothetical protein